MAIVGGFPLALVCMCVLWWCAVRMPALSCALQACDSPMS